MVSRPVACYTCGNNKRDSMSAFWAAGYLNVQNRNEPSGDAFDAANAWYHRLQGDNVTETDRDAFRKWCAQSPDHEAAWEDVQTFASDIRITLAQKPPVPARSTIRRPRGSRRSVLALGSLGLAIACIAMLSSGWRDWLQADYCSGQGEQKTVTLADGSVATLSPNSALKILPDTHGRGLALLHGEVWFSVHHDSAHPFYVLAGKGRVTDVGTRFDLRYLDGQTNVAVGEGMVDVAYGPPPPDHVRLTAGQDISYGTGGLGGIQAVDPDDIGAWRKGNLVFRQKPLAEVVAELNRYGSTKLVLASLQGRNRPVSGTFVIGQEGTALNAIHEAFGLRILRFTRYLTVLY